MIGRVEQRVDLGDGHPLGGLFHFHDVVSGTHFAWLQDAEVESWASAGREQCWHAGLIHANAEAIASNTRLSHLEQCAADPISITDTHRTVGQSFNGEVLAELPIDEVGPFQLLLPVPIRFQLVDVDRALLTSVARKIALAVSLQIQPADAAPAGYRILPDRSVDRATLPRDVAWEADVYRAQLSHGAPRSLGPGGRFGDGQIAIGAVGNHRLAWLEVDLHTIDVHGD